VIPLTPKSPSAFSAIEWHRRPNAGISPTKLTVVNCFKKWEVTNNNGKELLEWEGVTEFYWFDDRLVGFPISEGMPETIWRPKPIGNMGFDLGPAESYKLVPSFDTKAKISDGNIKMHVKFKLSNGGVNLSEQLARFHAFPYDSLRVDVSMILNNPHKEGDELPYLDVHFDRPNLPNRLADGKFQQVDWTAVRHSDDYALVCFGFAVGHNYEDWMGPPKNFTGLLLSLHIQRTPNFYFRKGIVPLYLVSLFGLLTFFLEPADLPARISVLSALFLTVYAIQWVTVERLPRLPFNTVLDGVAESVVGILIVNVMGMCVAFRAGRPPEGCFGDCLDFDVPAAAFWDKIFASFAFFFVIGYSVCYQVLYQRWKIGKSSGWTRPWHAGSLVTCKRISPTKAYRLWTDEEFAEKHGKKFLGDATPEPNDTW
jgi:hypothetical protein